MKFIYRAWGFIHDYGALSSLGKPPAMEKYGSFIDRAWGFIHDYGALRQNYQTFSNFFPFLYNTFPTFSPIFSAKLECPVYSRTPRNSVNNFVLSTFCDHVLLVYTALCKGQYIYANQHFANISHYAHSKLIFHEPETNIGHTTPLISFVFVQQTNKSQFAVNGM